MAADRVDRFPTYAEHMHTQAWTRGSSVQIAPADDEPLVDSDVRYTDREVLGVGGMGKILLSQDARIGREVAVKQLRADRELIPEERSRFLREAQVQGQLEHPSIVPVYDLDRRPDGTLFFTMRRVLGRTLEDILDDLRHGVPEAVARYTQRELLQAFSTVCLAVDYAHSRGVIHRDLKPANIMLGDFGEVYVLDWGLARLLEPRTDGAPRERLSMPGVALGTPLYMAPEQLDDPNVDTAADVFSLGAILFEILTLERLRTTGQVAAPVDARASVRAPERWVPLQLESLCVRATQHDPADRVPSARTLQETVARYLEGDRELEQRRELAAAHARRARAALRLAGEPNADHERESGTAIRELARALALEPTNQEHVAMFAEILSAPPRAMPPEVSDRIDAHQQSVTRAGARYALFGVFVWFLFLPPALALGIRRFDHVLLVAIPVCIAAALSAMAMRRRAIGRLIQCTTIAAIMLAAAGSSRVLGPLILVPTILAVWAIVMQTSPDRLVRRFSLVAGLFLMVAPLGLELAGVVPSSYAFEGGKLIILPQMTELPRLGTFAFATFAHAVAVLVPSVFVSRLRSDLTRAQERELLQAWQFRRLATELMHASPR